MGTGLMRFGYGVGAVWHGLGIGFVWFGYGVGAVWHGFNMKLVWIWCGYGMFSCVNLRYIHVCIYAAYKYESTAGPLRHQTATLQRNASFAGKIYIRSPKLFLCATCHPNETKLEIDCLAVVMQAFQRHLR